MSREMELGVMIDCSRNAVMSVDGLKRFLDLLAAMGYRFAGLYTEDTIEVPGEPYFGYQRGRLTLEEIREADAYAAGLGMELRPYIQTLAHLNQITLYEDYREIIDTADILMAGEERTYELLDRLLGAVSAAYRTRKVNIGMDEAHMVGLGRYLDRHGYEDRVSILMRHLERVTALCAKHGLEPQMWSDMFFRLVSHGDYYGEGGDTSALSDIRVPEGLELVYWDYYSQDEERYRRMLSRHRLLTDRIAFAGGAWRWSGFAPHNAYSVRTARAALAACREQGISSFVMTMWGDDGSECSPFALLPALFLTAREARRPGGASGREELFSEEDSAAFRELTGYSLEEFMALDCVNPGTEDGRYRNNLSKILLLNDPLLGSFDSLVPEGAAATFRACAQRLHEVLEKGPRPFDGLFETEEALAAVLSRKADLGVRLRTAYQAGDLDGLKEIAGELGGTVLALDMFYDAFQRQWMSEQKPFGFEVQTIRIGGLKQRLLDIRRRVADYAAGRADAIGELEAEALPCGYGVRDENAPENIEFNRYRAMATTGRISF